MDSNHPAVKLQLHAYVKANGILKTLLLNFQVERPLASATVADKQSRSVWYVIFGAKGILGKPSDLNYDLNGPVSPAQ